MPPFGSAYAATLLIAVILSVSFSSAESHQSSVTQHGITWYFDKEYQIGNFANGDYWVLGPVTITRITPDFDGKNNGWEINPVVSGGQGFQSDCSGGGFNPELVPSLPFTSPESGIISIVKTIPTGTSRPCIKIAAVLTVVTSIPPGDGLEVFRPPYVGEEKPYYHVANLRTDLLPSYSPVGNPTSLDYIENRFRMLRLDHKTGALGRALRPQDSMNDYQPKNSEDLINSVLRFMLNDSIEDKMPALIQYVQAGIDRVHTVLIGQTWPAGGGHQPAHLLPSAFTAVMLDVHQVKDVLREADFFHSSEYLSVSSRQGNHLWGQGGTTETQYWNYIMTGSGSRSHHDPYGYIDGGECGTAYQIITSQSHKGEVLAASLMPVLKTSWPINDFSYAVNYAERWVDHGIWSQPDPCAPYDGISANHGITFGPDPSNPGRCILDPDLEYFISPADFKCKEGLKCGRYPEKHGTNADTGQYRSAFVAAMWDTYYGGEPQQDTTPPERSRGNPAGELPKGTASASISLTTNEPATCRYSATPGMVYDTMTTTFASTGTTSHSQEITGLENGAAYTYYVRCIDSSGNANTDDFIISISVASAAACSPADTSGDGVVSMAELIVHINKWKTGSVQMPELMTAIREWKEGC